MSCEDKYHEHVRRVHGGDYMSVSRDEFKSHYNAVTNRQNATYNNDYQGSRNRRNTMEVAKLNLHKFDGAVISDGYLCIPVPKEGTGAKGLYQGKNGAVYCDCIIWRNDQPDDYGNHSSIQISVSKEERDAGVKGAYLGNIKTI